MKKNCARLKLTFFKLVIYMRNDNQWVTRRVARVLQVSASLDAESVKISTYRGKTLITITSDSLNKHTLLAPALAIASIALLVTTIAAFSLGNAVLDSTIIAACVVALLFAAVEALGLIVIASIEKHVMSEEDIENASYQDIVLRLHEQQDVFGITQTRLERELQTR